MPRPQKKGFDYFPFDVDFFSDRKIKILRARFGADGLTVYLYLLCEIYKTGFYIKLDKDFEFIIADDLNMSVEKIQQIIAFLSERSLLDSTLLRSDTVLTSAGIQKRWQEMMKSRASKTPASIDGRYWLLSEEETEDCLCGLLSFSEKNPDFSEKNDTKKSKVKESKVNQIESAGAPAHERGNLMAYGSLKNVLLTEEEHADLLSRFSDAAERIEVFGAKLAAKGYKYDNHYAAILLWYQQDKKEAGASSFDVDEFFQAALANTYS